VVGAVLAVRAHPQIPPLVVQTFVIPVIDQPARRAGGDPPVHVDLALPARPAGRVGEVVEAVGIGATVAGVLRPPVPIRY
jgi:hypothetical protein